MEYQQSFGDEFGSTATLSGTTLSARIQFTSNPDDAIEHRWDLATLDLSTLRWVEEADVEFGTDRGIFGICRNDSLVDVELVRICTFGCQYCGFELLERFRHLDCPCGGCN